MARHRTAYPAHDGLAPPTLRHQVSGTAAALAVVVPAIFHVIPVASPRTKAERGLWVDGDGLVGAVQRRREEDGAVLQQTLADLARGAGETVEGVEINVFSY